MFSNENILCIVSLTLDINLFNGGIITKAFMQANVCVKSDSMFKEGHCG